MDEFCRSPLFRQALFEVMARRCDQYEAALAADLASGNTFTFSQNFLKKMDSLIYGSKPA